MGATDLHKHSVQFYADEQSLFATVSAFLAQGLATGQPAIIIATVAHTAGVVDHLCNRMIDCERAIKAGALVIEGAQQTLDKFMVNGRPSKALFERHVGRVVGDLAARHGGAVIRAYGEMVDVLWKQGRREAAIQVEVLWNDLAGTHNFALLCGYAMGSFYKQTQQMDAIAALHTHVIDTPATVVPFRSLSAS